MPSSMAITSTEIPLPIACIRFNSGRGENGPALPGWELAGQGAAGVKGRLVRQVKQAAFAERNRWAWHPGNRARLLVDGVDYFPAMLEAIAQARERVLLEFYSGQFRRVDGSLD